MKKINLFAILATILLGISSLYGYDVFRGKTEAILEKSGLKQQIIDSQLKIPDAVVFKSHASGDTIYSSTFTVSGVATGKKIEYVEVKLDSATCQGAWKKADGTEQWQIIFNGCSNRTYTIKARAYNSKGLSEESSISVTVSKSGPLVRIIQGPTNNFVTTHDPFTNKLIVNENYGYWSTNGSEFFQLSTGVTQTIIFRTNAVLRYYGIDSLGNTNAMQTKTYTFDNAAPLVTIIAGPTNNILTNASFMVTLNASENFGYWSTNGSPFKQFPAGTVNIPIGQTTTLIYYGQDSLGNSSSIKTRTYTLPPIVKIVSGPTNNVVTNQVFSVKLAVNKNWGYWSTNGHAFQQFNTGATQTFNIKTNTILRYYGKDFVGITSSTQTRTYIIDKAAPVVRIVSGSTNSIVTNHIFSIKLAVNENWGYWSTNGQSFQQFNAGITQTLVIKTNTILKYYGKDVWNNTSLTQTKTYTVDLITPIIRIVSGPTNNVVTNLAFTVKLAVNENWGYWSTNGHAFQQFNTGVTQTFNIKTNTTFRYYAKDLAGNTSPIKTVLYEWKTPGLLFALNGPGYTVSKGTANTSGTVGIPSYYSGLPVTSISNNAFKNCTTLTNIIIPNTIKSIGASAFYGCSGLVNAAIPSSVTNIGTNAFYGCPKLASVAIPNGVTSIGVNAFYGCAGLTSVSIPNSVTSIGGGAFRYCTGLISIVIPNSVTSIGAQAFQLCSGLTNVTIPNSVTIIAAQAFHFCSGLTSIIIPNSVTFIGDNAFQSCVGLTSITIPNSVTSIGTSAFSYCAGLTNIVIPNSVTSIGDYVFYECTGLTNVTMQRSSPPTLGASVFLSTSASLQIHVPSAAAVIAYQAAANWSAYAAKIVTP